MLQHIVFKELNAVRVVIESFLRELKEIWLLLNKDSQIVMRMLTHLTSWSPAKMSKLRKLFLLNNEHDISIKIRKNRSAANVWVDRLSRETNIVEWQLAPRIFRYYDKRWDPHFIDRFASVAKKQLPSYNA
jgi:hypothetical protein